MTTATLFGPSEKQVGFINSLLEERELEEDARLAWKQALLSMDKKTASSLIDMLLKLPKATTKIVVSGSIQEALLKAPKSKYAIPNEEIDISLTSTKLSGDMMFVEIREYMGRLYMKRLTGSLGGFTRWRLANEDALTLVNIVAKDPYKYAKLFGTVYSCCGSCGAELTDPTSRELQLGPECRKKFGR